MIFSMSYLSAQEMRGMPKVRALLMENQMNEIKKRVSIDPENVGRFEKIYNNYVNELAEINRTTRTQPLNDKNLQLMSDGDVEKAFMMQSLRAQKLLLLREKYFHQFRSVLSAKDVVIIFKMEREVVDRAHMEMKRRVDMMKKPEMNRNPMNK